MPHQPAAKTLHRFLTFPDWSPRLPGLTIGTTWHRGLMDHTARIDEWRRRLLYCVGGLLAFETLTGLAVYLLPFSVSNQVMVLLHTVAGLVFILPYAWYQIRHWRLYHSLRWSHEMLTGYFSMAATL